MQASIKERLFAKSAFKRAAEENYYSYCESHELSLMTRTKRRTFNKFPPHYLKIGLLSALFRFPRREAAKRARIRGRHYALRESLSVTSITDIA